MKSVPLSLSRLPAPVLSRFACKIMSSESYRFYFFGCLAVFLRLHVIRSDKKYFLVIFLSERRNLGSLILGIINIPNAVGVKAI